MRNSKQSFILRSNSIYKLFTVRSLFTFRLCLRSVCTLRLLTVTIHKCSPYSVEHVPTIHSPCVYCSSGKVERFRDCTLYFTSHSAEYISYTSSSSSSSCFFSSSSSPDDVPSSDDVSSS